MQSAELRVTYLKESRGSNIEVSRQKRTKVRNRPQLILSNITDLASRHYVLRILLTDAVKKEIIEEVSDDGTGSLNDLLIVHTKTTWGSPRKETFDDTFEVNNPALWL